MRILIAYYSSGGGTKRLADAIKKALEDRGHLIDIERITVAKERTFWNWLLLRWFKGKCEIQTPTIINASPYDVVLIGSPNWTGLSLPMAEYLRQLAGLQDKEICLFSTTAMPPAMEWYIVSAYLLDIIFTRIVEKGKGRPKSSLMLSSIFKRWGVDSDYGRKLIDKFCAETETPIRSIKNYFLEKKETDGIRFLAVFFSSVLILSLISQIILPHLGIKILDWPQYSLVGFIMLNAFLFITYLREKGEWIFLAKYLGGLSIIMLWTVTIAFTHPILGRLIIWGYFLIFTLIGFFRNRKLIIFTGLITLLSYTFLYFSYQQSGILVPSLDLGLLLFSLFIVDLITMSLQKHFIDLLEAQEEIEATKATLETKIRERTNELKKLTENLDNQVREKTSKLQEKIDELESFNKLVVGRELKMMGLKEEIERLKKDSQNKK
jgi:hypothetical protein